MLSSPIIARWAAALVVCVATLSSAQTPQQFKFNAGPDTAVSITNDFGDVNVHPGTGRQVIVSASPSSQSIKVEATQSGNRIDVRTRRVQQGISDPVNYEVTVPMDARVSVRTAQGQIQIEKLKGDVTAETDSGKISVSDIGSAHVHLRSLSGPMSVSNVRNGHVELSSIGGPIDMNAVNGPYVSANTTDGKITYRGNFGGAGDYSLTTHKGDIDVFLPAKGSYPLNAHSIKGTVESDFQPQANSYPDAPSPAGSTSLTGDSKAGSPSVQLRSFSGKIRVKKQ
jgi:DUF4097 and DUF4098 domain-containing protein YvlB